MKKMDTWKNWVNASGCLHKWMKEKANWHGLKFGVILYTNHYHNHLAKYISTIHIISMKDIELTHILPGQVLALDGHFPLSCPYF